MELSQRSNLLSQVSNVVPHSFQNLSPRVSLTQIYRLVVRSRDSEISTFCASFALGT